MASQLNVHRSSDHTYCFSLSIISCVSFCSMTLDWVSSSVLLNCIISQRHVNLVIHAHHSLQNIQTHSVSVCANAAFTLSNSWQTASCFSSALSSASVSPFTFCSCLSFSARLNFTKIYSNQTYDIYIYIYTCIAFCAIEYRLTELHASPWFSNSWSSILAMALGCM